MTAERTHFVSIVFMQQAITSSSTSIARARTQLCCCEFALFIHRTRSPLARKCAECVANDATLTETMYILYVCYECNAITTIDATLDVMFSLSPHSN